MSLILTEEQQLIRETARDFFADRAPVAAFRELRDSQLELGYQPSLWNEMLDLGWAGTAIGEQYGGVGLGYLELGLVLEEGGRTLAASPLFSTVLCAATVIERLATGEQKAELLPKICSGEQTYAVAIEETTAHRRRPTSTCLSRSAGQLSLTGRKTLVFDGHSADRLIVAALDESAMHPVFALVDPTSAGVEIKRQQTIDSRNCSEVLIDSLAIEADQIIGAGSASQADYESVLDIVSIGAAAELLGISREVFARTLAYLRERRQFDRIIGSFQALQHRAAMWHCELELCHSIVLRALQAIDQNRSDLALLASAAKAKASACALLSCAEGVQLHGGIGMTDELDIGLFLKRAQVLSQAFGGESFHLNRLAELKGF